jgi:hypothetical protein
LKSEVRSAKTAARPGLYYDRINWTGYLKESLQNLTREIQKNKSAAGLKPVFVISDMELPGNMRAQSNGNVRTNLRREPLYIS